MFALIIGIVKFKYVIGQGKFSKACPKKRLWKEAGIRLFQAISRL